MRVGEQMNDNLKNMLAQTLKENINIFAWTVADMVGIDPSVACHRLVVYKDTCPIARKKRKMGEERRVATEMEVDKLLKAQFIREVCYMTYLANVVLVMKVNENWRMSVDYIDLNKSFPIDTYPLPSIGRLVDGASGHQILSFLDAYSWL